MKKYKIVNGFIVALIDIPQHDVKAGDTGGRVDSYQNLSQDGTSWIGKHACVLDNASVTGNAYVTDTSILLGNVWVGDSACVYGRSVLMGDVEVDHSARVNSCVLQGDVVLRRMAVAEFSQMRGNVTLTDRVKVNGAFMQGHLVMRDTVQVHGTAHLDGDGVLSGGTVISRTRPNDSRLSLTIPKGVDLRDARIAHDYDLVLLTIPSKGVFAAYQNFKSGQVYVSSDGCTIPLDEFEPEFKTSHPKVIAFFRNYFPERS